MSGPLSFVCDLVELGVDSSDVLVGLIEEVVLVTGVEIAVELEEETKTVLPTVKVRLSALGAGAAKVCVVGLLQSTSLLPYVPQQDQLSSLLL